MYSNVNDAREFLVKELVSQGILGKDQQDAEIAAVVAAIPTATRAEYGEDDIVAAANYWPTYQAAKGAISNASNPASLQSAGAGAVIKATRSSAEFIPPVLADEVMEAARELVQAKAAERVQNTAQTSINTLLVENPPASEMYGKLRVIPRVTVEKLGEYEKLLVDDPENKAAFKRVKEAVNKTALSVYCNDKNRRLRGVRVKTPASGEGKGHLEDIILTIEGLFGFLATKVIGRIPSDKTGIGVVMTAIKAAQKAGKKADATAPKGKPRVKWVGKTAALKEGRNIEVINEVEKVGNKVETRKGRLRIADSFKVYVGDERNSKGERKTRTIRLSGESNEVPVMTIGRAHV
jgi:hypothetical protein